MKNKGFTGFALIIAIITLLLFFSISLNQNNETLNKTKNELIKAEWANKERTILENNVDKIIETKLNEQITLQNFNTSIAKNSINQKLSSYLNEKAQVYGTTNQNGKISTTFLNQNSSIQLLKSEYLIYAEYVFSPNFVATQVKQKLGNKLISEFIFPSNYTKTIMRVV